MYPLFWTNQKGGIFMHYSYEFKRKCVEMYRNGEWPDKPDCVKSTHDFHSMIRRWARLEDNCGPETLKHTGHNKRWNPDEKLELISLVLAGNSNQSVALEAGINPGLLYSWVRKYKMFGYNGLVNKPMGRKSSEQSMKKQVDNKARPLTESEREELIRLRAEIAYIKAENEVIKKEIALREEKEAARLKAKKQRSSKNSGKKGMN